MITMLDKTPCSAHVVLSLYGGNRSWVIASEKQQIEANRSN